MTIRRAELEEYDQIYLMGSDVWSEGESLESYLEGCRDSDKYRMGRWFVLSIDGELNSSLIVYEKCFGLPDGFHGIGSVATVPQARKRGHASNLVRGVCEELRKSGSTGVFLHSDISQDFYEALGFETLKFSESGQSAQCMLLSFDVKNGQINELPSYF